MLAQYLYRLLCTSQTVISLTEHEFDITSDSLPAAVPTRNLRYIVNCAAFTDVDGAERNPILARRVNAFGARNLALLAKRTDATLVHFSTDFIFDGNTNIPYGVYDTPNPLSQYGYTKWLGECMIRDVGCRYLIVRTSWLFGSGKRNFISAVIDKARAQRSLDVVCDQIGNPTYAADLAQATLKLMSCGALGTFHASNTGICSRSQLATTAIKAAGLNSTVREIYTTVLPGMARRPLFSALDPFPLEETIGHLLPPWEDAVERYIIEANLRMV